MPNLTPWFLLLFSGVTALMMALSVPMMRRRIGPNLLYGVRTPKTLADERVWYESNAYGGRLLFRTGLVQLIAVIALFFVPGLHANFVAYNVACSVVIVGGLLFSTALVLLKVRAL